MNDLMGGGSIFLVEPVSGIERQKLDLGSFGQIGWPIDNQAASLDPSLQCHVTTAGGYCGPGLSRRLIENALIDRYTKMCESYT